MTNIHLTPITRDNWRDCIRLTVARAQESFVASNAKSLAQAAYEDYCFPMGIYDGDTMVGFVMYGYEPIADYKLWYVERLMVGEQYQAQGYGRKGMELVIDKIKSETDAQGLVISYLPDNHVAARLYERLGFVDEGLTIEGEILVVMRFPHKIHISSTI